MKRNYINSICEFADYILCHINSFFPPRENCISTYTSYINYLCKINSVLCIDAVYKLNAMFFLFKCIFIIRKQA